MLALLVISLGGFLFIRWIIAKKKELSFGQRLRYEIPSAPTSRESSVPDPDLFIRAYNPASHKPRRRTVVGTLAHQKEFVYRSEKYLAAYCYLCVADPPHVFFSSAIDSSGNIFKRVCPRCLFRYGGVGEFDKAMRESPTLASIWRYMTALDQLVAEFPDPSRRPWGDEMLRDAIVRGYLGDRGEAIVAKILAREWTERDRARIAGLPDPGPPVRKASELKEYCVYAHVDHQGKRFYIGKGKTKPQISKDGRNEYWNWYVERHLKGKYTVSILHENLSDKEAGEIKARLIDAGADDLVNLVNPARSGDEHVFSDYLALRHSNRDEICRCKKIEPKNLELAVAEYIAIIASLNGVAPLRYSRGLVGRLAQEMDEVLGKQGEIDAIDRLSLCLIKLGRLQEVIDRVYDYFTEYRRDKELPVARRILGRAERAMLYSQGRLEGSALKSWPRLMKAGEKRSVAPPG